MAYLKLYRNQDAKSTLKYVRREGSRENDPVSAHGCTVDTAESDFASTAKSWGVKSKYEVLHLIQSWNETESRMFPAEHFHEIGKKLVETYFKGHEYVMRTHTDTPKTHNHIVVNIVNYETGKMVEDKKHHLYRLRELSDKLCLESGLSIINKEGKDRQARLPEAVQRMKRFNRDSWVLDTKSKAKFARSYATSYDEYSAILSELGVSVKVEEKNITYFYPGHSRGKRGSKLGLPYDKAGLEESFKSNDQLFASKPEL